MFFTCVVACAEIEAVLCVRVGRSEGVGPVVLRLGGGVGVGVLRRSSVMWAAAEKFVLVVGVDADFALFLELVELDTVGGEIGAKVLQTVRGFVFLLLVEFVAREILVVVESAGEGGEGGRYLAL